MNRPLPGPRSNVGIPTVVRAVSYLGLRDQYPGAVAIKPTRDGFEGIVFVEERAKNVQD